MVKSYKELKVWQRSMELVKDVYSVTKKLPKEEIYVISSQLRRAVISIPLNISEGRKYSTRKEYNKFLRISYGSASEVETILEIIIQLDYISRDALKPTIKKVDEIKAMLYKMTEGGDRKSGVSRQ